MPRRTDLKRVLVIGSGPIVIGQACEFDYSGSQACKALRAEGLEVILVNSNPATIMTDPELADRTYVEPLTTDFLEAIIARERPDAILPTVGGQTALNLAVDLANAGILAKYDVKLIGASIDAIKIAEDRQPHLGNSILLSPLNIEAFRKRRSGPIFQNITPPFVPVAADAHVVWNEIRQQPHAALPGRFGELGKSILTADHGVDLLIIPHIVIMRAVRRGRVDRRKVQIGDSEFGEIIQQRLSSSERKLSVQLNSIRRAWNSHFSCNTTVSGLVNFRRPFPIEAELPLESSISQFGPATSTSLLPCRSQNTRCDGYASSRTLP